MQKQDLYFQSVQCVIKPEIIRNINLVNPLFNLHNFVNREKKESDHNKAHFLGDSITQIKGKPIVHQREADNSKMDIYRNFQNEPMQRKEIGSLNN